MENTVKSISVWYPRSFGIGAWNMVSIIKIVMDCLICIVAGWGFSFIAGKLKDRLPRQEATPDPRAYDPF